jgi:hypothetical protein
MEASFPLSQNGVWQNSISSQILGYCVCILASDSANIVYNSLSKMGLWWICKKCSHQPIWAHFNQTSFDSESFGYFKICRDLEEVAIIKSVPNWISYSHKLSWICPHFLSIWRGAHLSYSLQPPARSTCQRCSSNWRSWAPHSSLLPPVPA